MELKMLERIIQIKNGFDTFNPISRMLVKEKVFLLTRFVKLNKNFKTLKH